MCFHEHKSIEYACLKHICGCTFIGKCYCTSVYVRKLFFSTNKQMYTVQNNEEAITEQEILRNRSLCIRIPAYWKYQSIWYDMYAPVECISLEFHHYNYRAVLGARPGRGVDRCTVSIYFMAHDRTSHRKDRTCANNFSSLKYKILKKIKPKTKKVRWPSDGLTSTSKTHCRDVVVWHSSTQCGQVLAVWK